ncbi:3-oxoacyl-ACP reductase [Meridianimarinicoccus roseus]|uniref:3-oxoacyl-ACP reductase n=1 Tax=Meridianimarinicoccus roseus TaxID=2072018 RepID=A0A2V2LDV6_9RHOB|nr:SDR family oxidoreductase [Meridianimarinicoccus roseus]PWR03595.1 3-oxoacyl-ACP reductase [Meridianimarinicoccus roseus]
MTGANTILITGAGSGIGRATARRFLGAGWRVALVGRRADALEETADGAEGALVLPCDVTDEDGVTGAFVRVAEDWGHLEVLFNNAGGGLGGKLIDEIDPAEFRRVVEVNVVGMFLCARAAFGLMRRQEPQGGRIINNGSISAHAPRPGSVAYTTTKHAVTGLTRTLSLDGRPFRIACGQIDIGNAMTDLAAPMATGVPQADGSVKPEPVMDVGHVADAVFHMAGLPLDANVQFMTVMATNMPFIGRG